MERNTTQMLLNNHVWLFFGFVCLLFVVVVWLGVSCFLFVFLSFFISFLFPPPPPPSDLQQLSPSLHPINEGCCHSVRVAARKVAAAKNTFATSNMHFEETNLLLIVAVKTNKTSPLSLQLQKSVKLYTYNTSIYGLQTTSRAAHG